MAARFKRNSPGGQQRGLVGEFVAIVGPSGSGKSTLMQILGLLDRPTGGSYQLMGRDVSSLTDDEGAVLRSRAPETRVC